MVGIPDRGGLINFSQRLRLGPCRRSVALVVWLTSVTIEVDGDDKLFFATFTVKIETFDRDPGSRSRFEAADSQCITNGWWVSGSIIDHDFMRARGFCAVNCAPAPFCDERFQIF